MSYAHRIAPGAKVRLKEFDPDQASGLTKEQGIAAFHKLETQFDVVQEQLYAAGANSVLVVLQGMDTSGKDGAIRSVFRNCNPQGMRVESFKVPTEEELAHDFLWRVHQVTPRKGMLGIFNRSHYEDVLVVRVHELVSEEVWQARYEQINAFESLLAAQGTIILKFFLHISKAEQEQRLLEREQDIEKAWKLAASDWRERALWEKYTDAYEDALSQCSTSHAPWYIVPANRKWYRNLAIAQVLVETLEGHRKHWNQTLTTMAEARKAELAAFRTKQ
jgi:PPK2 family polyphosphate:nucleotide phosphotransferase